jgi:hypothetical protein
MSIKGGYELLQLFIEPSLHPAFPLPGRLTQL